MDKSQHLYEQLQRDGSDDVVASQKVLKAYDMHLVTERLEQYAPQAGGSRNKRTFANYNTGETSMLEADVAAYSTIRSQLCEAENKLSFDSRCRRRATSLERDVDSIIHKLRKQDAQFIYASVAPRVGCSDQTHPRFAGDHFLSNVELINKTALFKIAQRMPKGSHLHIHYNACLPPDILLGVAKQMDRMFIMSNMPLSVVNNCESFRRCELQFSIMRPEMERPGNVFSSDYQPRQTMKFSDFLHSFPEKSVGATADGWLQSKLVFDEQEAHGHLQTAAGIWEKFNARTKMMKGLFNYETAYRTYTRLCLEDFVRDHIQYAEIRPNFMTNNQLCRDDGTGTIDNWGIMRLIIEEVQEFQVTLSSQGRYFGGIKVIYCTPRSFEPEVVKMALKECLAFKKHWPEWIAGFDLVGEEGKGRPIKDFIPELLEFQNSCRLEQLDIPFLFHCGETLDFATDTDGNLIDALLLNSRRIGHGFALVKHPLILQQMRARGICVELCPISNEILGLTPRVSGHAMYNLLANNIHCTVSSDNGAIFRSTLSHDFYQVLIGKADMGIFGWKQLILWSIEHSCLNQLERESLLREWELMWGKFLTWVVEEYASALP